MSTPSPRGVPSAMPRARVGLSVAIAAFLVYAALFIYRTSFVMDGTRYFSLFDDAMISMRYGRHLAGGLGLVWNPGERVEGYTNPLWVGFMALVHLLPIPLAKTSSIVQVTAAILLALNLAIVHRIALAVADASEAVALGAVVLTGWYLPLNNWSLQGMEVSLLVAIVSASVWLCIRCLDGDDVVRGLYVLLGASTWVRPDMAVTLAAVAAFMIIVDAPRRRQHAVWGAGAFVLGLASQTLFRLWYFGAPFPNTYYLKMTGYPAVLRVARGAYVLVQFVWKANPLLFAVVVATFPWRDRRSWLLAFIVSVQMAYSAYVGGDAWEYWGGANRYISIAMPAFFILLSGRLHAIHPRRGGFVLLVAISVLSLNAIYGTGALEEWLLIKAPLHSGPGDENARDVETAIALDRVSAPNASVGVTRAGTIPYFSERRGIDFLGKVDSRIAHEPSRVPGGARRFMDFRPGHSKWDDGYSIGELQPDVIVHVWNDPKEAAPFLRDYRRYALGPACVYVRVGSPRVQAGRLPPCRDAK